MPDGVALRVREELPLAVGVPEAVAAAVPVRDEVNDEIGVPDGVDVTATVGALEGAMKSRGRQGLATL